MTDTLPRTISFAIRGPLERADLPSLYERFSSRGNNAFAAKVNAALRNQFGGHAIKAADPVAQAEAHAE